MKFEIGVLQEPNGGSENSRWGVNNIGDVISYHAYGLEIIRKLSSTYFIAMNDRSNVQSPREGIVVQVSAKMKCTSVIAFYRSG